MWIKIKGYAKFVERQFEVHMGYDGKNKDMVNPSGKHQWCLWMQSMSMLNKEENIAKLGATLPQIKMIAYERCMKIGVVLNAPYTK